MALRIIADTAASDSASSAAEVPHESTAMSGDGRMPARVIGVQAGQPQLCGDQRHDGVDRAGLDGQHRRAALPRPDQPLDQVPQLRALVFGVQELHHRGRRPGRDDRQDR
jgi:hypothetical protein